ncbi:MAG: hypothetical protein QNJ42_21300 [Crocosphaera sp.]|nr:hypothetical protein [Crocosphaera sp.]
MRKKNMKIKGIKRGQTIELLETVDDIADGEEVVVEISPVTFHPLANLNPQERQKRIKQVLGAWQNDPEIDAIFAEIDQDRHSYQGRQIDSLDN